MAILTIFQIVWLAFLPPFVHLLCSSLFQLVDSGVVAHRNGAFWAHYDEKPTQFCKYWSSEQKNRIFATDILIRTPKSSSFSLESKTEEFYERYIRRKSTHTNESHALQKMRHPTRYKGFTTAKIPSVKNFFVRYQEMVWVVVPYCQIDHSIMKKSSRVLTNGKLLSAGVC